MNIAPGQRRCAGYDKPCNNPADSKWSYRLCKECEEKRHARTVELLKGYLQRRDGVSHAR